MWSILVLSVPGREDKLSALLKELWKQITEANRQDLIEVLCLYDTKNISVGQKRNTLIQASSGRFVSFIDDDDRISVDYVKDISQVLRNNPKTDCVVFNVSYTDAKNPDVSFMCDYGIGMPLNHDYKMKRITSPPGHIHVFNRDVYTKIMFANISRGEDYQWMMAVKDIVTKQVVINKILYFYDFDITKTETQRC